MLRLDFLYHALTTLTAFLPSFLTPESRSDSPIASHHIPETPITSHHTTESTTPETPQFQSPNVSEPSHNAPPPLKLQTEPPLRTSRKRVDSMNSAKMHNNNVQIIQDLPSAKDAGVLNYNTGFPEPLSPDRNTTLPHPSADTSKNATIEAEDVELTRTRSKSRFLHSRHHRTVSGKIVPEAGPKVVPGEEKKHEGIEYADGSKEKGGANGVAKDVANGEEVNGGLKKGAEKNEEELRLEKERDEQGYGDGERKKGVLRKLNLHKV